MPYAHIAGSVSGTTFNDILNRINSIREDLPFLVHLTEKERKNGGRWKADLYSFLKKAQTGTEVFPDLLSSSFDKADWDAGIQLYEQLKNLLAAVAQLHEAISDTHLALRIQVQKKAGSFLNAAIDASRSNVPGSSELIADLRSALPKRRKKKEVAVEAAEPPIP